MSQDGHDNQRHGEALAAQQVFGPQAAVYATSKVHIRDDSLETAERMVEAANGANRTEATYATRHGLTGEVD